MSKQTFTLTFGNQAENHKGMQIIGQDMDEGLNSMDIDEIVDWVESEEGKYELIYLNDLLEGEEDADEADDAFLLIVKDGLNLLMGDKNYNKKLYEEQEKLEKDKKAWMYGRVVDKKARHNLCFSDFSQEADFQEGKGTVVNFKDVPSLKNVRERIGDLLENNKLKNLQCEGNYYYNLEETYIGFHGDSERKIVVAVRLGEDFPIFFRWYRQGEEKGKMLKKILKDGDIYFMSDKAVGHDWKKKKIYTLRHAAGFEKALKIMTEEEEKECIDNIQVVEGIIDGKRFQDFKRNGITFKTLTYYKDGKKGISGEEWYDEDGKLHRDGDKPALISYSKSGRIENETYFKHGTIHRENDQPAEIHYQLNGTPISKKWRIEGLLHRENDKPAIIFFHKNGNIESEEWRKNHLTYDRKNGKSNKIGYFPDGGVKYENWYKPGQKIMNPKPL